MIILGPNLSAASYDEPQLGDFAPTGYALELFINQDDYEIPIYQDSSHWRLERPDFIDYYLVHQDVGWPFDFPYWNFQEKRDGDHSLVRISPFLQTLFTNHIPEGDVVSFLTDFRAHLPVHSEVGISDTYRPSCEINLSSELTAGGFSVTGVVHHGRELAVELAWSFGDSHPTWRKIHAGRITFLVSEGGLKKAAWKPHHWPESIEDLFWRKLQNIAPADPLACFASAADLDGLLSHIEWEPTLTMSAGEIKKLRIQCINEFKELWEKPLEVANHLLARQLYAASTTPHQIAKTVAKTVAGLRQNHGSSTAEKS